MTAASRKAFIAPDRLPGWVERFTAAHGGLKTEETDDGVLLTAADGATALLQPPWPVAGRPGRGDTAIQRLASLSGQNRTVAVVLLRRGGYAVGLCQGGLLLASKVGTRHVQSRTAAGGWSQQRFARRRSNQADALVDAVAGHAARLLIGAGEAGGSPSRAEYLTLGGDRALCQSLLQEPALQRLARLPQLAFLDVPDPRSAVLKQAARDLRAVRVLVSDPPPG